MDLRTRALMSTSALLLFAAGMALSFVADDVLALLVNDLDPVAFFLAQVVGAAWLGLAFLNWMNRGMSMGGIYGRPVSMPNFMHFAILAILFVKLALARPSLLTLAAAAVTSLFAAWFALVVFNPPMRRED